jgi:hypothetical protein
MSFAAGSESFSYTLDYEWTPQGMADCAREDLARGHEQLALIHLCDAIDLLIRRAEHK